MRVNKNSYVYIWADFKSQEGEGAVVTGGPRITIIHYTDSIHPDIEEQAMASVGGGVYNFKFYCSLDAFYCATIKANYQDETEVSFSQAVISGKPENICVFGRAINQEGEVINLESPEYRVFRGDSVISDWKPLSEYAGQLYYGIINEPLVDDVYLAQFRGGYDGLNLAGSYVFGGGIGSGGGHGADITISPGAVTSIIKPNEIKVAPVIRPGSGMSISNNVPGIETKPNIPKIKVK